MSHADRDSEESSRHNLQVCKHFPGPSISDKFSSSPSNDLNVSFGSPLFWDIECTLLFAWGSSPSAMDSLSLWKPSNTRESVGFACREVALTMTRGFVLTSTVTLPNDSRMQRVRVSLRLCRARIVSPEVLPLCGIWNAQSQYI